MHFYMWPLQEIPNDGMPPSRKIPDSAPGFGSVDLTNFRFVCARARVQVYKVQPRLKIGAGLYFYYFF